MSNPTPSVPSSERRDVLARQDLVVQLRAHFKERQRVALSVEDAASELGIDLDTSHRILTGLVSARVLRVTQDGRFAYRVTSHRYRT
jgi:DNA-binding IclR family transcriptional regulator